MKVINLMSSNSSPAPKEWKDLPEVKTQRPSPNGQESSLQRIDGTNICAWFSNSGNGLWTPNSDFFIVKSR